MAEEKIIDVPPLDAPVRLDKFLADAVGQSRAFVQKEMREERVRVGACAAKPNFLLKGGERVAYVPREAQSPEIPAQDIPLDILYEDDDLLVVNKPSGMVVHPAAGHESGTLVNALLWHCRGNLSGINGVLRPGIVHRIDRDTSGALVVCKNDFAHNSLAEQLKNHTITRAYRAIAHGSFREERGCVDAPIGRHPTDRKKMAVNWKNGKPAVTHYEVLRQYGNYSYLECRLETGRTHQIRVHLRSIGHPILGDPVYGPAKCPIPHLHGQVLHAMTLGFLHPRTGKFLTFCAPLPEEFQHLLDTL